MYNTPNIAKWGWGPEKRDPAPLKSRPRGFQNRGLGPPRHYFEGHLVYEDKKGASLKFSRAQNAQLGSNLEAQEAPKSRPEPQKIDVEKQHVFSIDF